VSLAAPRARAAEREETLADRFLAAFPLLAVFFWLCVVYAWEAWRHGSPWLFGDELELTQLSRAIADTGHAARRGQPHSFDSLYTYFIAPAWRIGNVHHAYDAVKYLNVLAMTATAFPAYKIARFLVGRRAALFAATGAVLIPALAYTSLIFEESLAYPYSTLCLYLIVAALVRRTRWWIAGAVVASIFAPLVRGELVVIPAVFTFALLFLLWRSQAASSWRARWRATDWIGAVVLVVGAAILLSAFLGHRSTQWLIATGFYKHRMFTLGMRAAGAFTIGLGVLPLVAGLAALWRAPGEVFRWELRVFRSVLLAAVISFGLYTAVKASYVSTTFATLTVERNLIYLAPLLMAGTALWIERRTAQPFAVGAAALLALYLVLTTPYEMDKRLDSDALGLALFQRLNRVQMFAFTPTDAKVVLILVLAATVAIMLVTQFVRRGALILAIVAAAFVLAWNGAGELSAAGSSNSFSESFLSNIHGKPTWVDAITGGAATLYLGQQMQDANGEWLLEFWNRSVKQVWSLDGTAPGPGPTLTPDLHATDGTLFPDPHYPYVVAEQGIEVVGSVAGVHYHRAGGTLLPWTLYRVSGPLRLRGAVTGLYADGWSGPYDSAYTRYSTAAGKAGTLRVTTSWRQWSGPNRAKVTVTMGTLAIGFDKQPRIGKVIAVKTWTIAAKLEKTFVFHAPGPRFRLEVHVSPHFRPHDYDPATGDRRELGAVITYTFSSKRR
jgi:Dolichyl-phosphate-mannose-protein mannosyltransferase